MQKVTKSEQKCMLLLKKCTSVIIISSHIEYVQISWTYKTQIVPKNVEFYCQKAKILLLS